MLAAEPIGDVVGAMDRRGRMGFPVVVDAVAVEEEAFWNEGTAGCDGRDRGLVNDCDERDVSERNEQENPCETQSKSRIGW